MIKLSVSCAAILALVPLAAAQAAEWGQCGGIGWTGPTTCVAGTVCVVGNPYYSQCLPGTSTGTATGTGTVATSATPTTPTTLIPTQTGLTGGYNQVASGNASFTNYGGCSQPACGRVGSGYTAAMNQFSFGAPPSVGPGDACGRCFELTGLEDPYSPAYTGPFNTIIVQVTDLCPVEGNSVWCAQSTSTPLNQFNQPYHFDICQDTGGATAFFPSGHGALTGTFKEVACTEWTGSDGPAIWNGACTVPTAPFWPTGVGCGNQGTAPA